MLRDHSLVVELSYPHFHHLSSLPRLDVEVGNESPSKLPSPHPHLLHHPFLPTLGRETALAERFFSLPDLKLGGIANICSTLTSCINWLQNTQVLFSSW